MGITGVLESHIIVFILTIIFGILFVLFTWRNSFRKKFILQIFKTILSTLLLNSFFLVPFIDYFIHHKLHGAEEVNMTETATEYLSTIFATYYGTFGAPPGIKYIGSMPLSLGYVSGIILVLALCLLFKGKFGKDGRHVTGILLLTFLAIWFCTNLFPYRFLYLHFRTIYMLFSKMQFPWRNLTMATVFVYIIAVLSMRNAMDKYGYRKAMLIGLVICFIAGYQALNFTSMYLNEARTEKDRGETIVGITDTFRQSGMEYNLFGTDIEKMKNNDPVVSTPETMTASISSRKGVSIVSEVTNRSDKTGYVDYPLQDYKGYHAADSSGNVLSISNGDNNRVRISIPAGYSGTVRVYFQEPWYWRAAELLSLAYLLCLLVRSRRHFCKNALARKNRVV